MNWKAGKLRNTHLSYINFIDYVGCNIIGLCRVGVTYDMRLHNETPQFAQSPDGWIKEVFNGLKDLTENDNDYSQLCLVQLSSKRQDLITLFTENLPLLFTQVVHGGHGNPPLTLIGIDLQAIRKKWTNPKWVEAKPEPKPKRKYVKSGKYSKKNKPVEVDLAAGYRDAVVVDAIHGWELNDV